MIRFSCWWNFTYWQLRKWAAEHTHTGVIQQLHYSFGNSQLTFKFVVRATVPVRHPGNNSYVGRTNITRKKMEKKKKKQCSYFWIFISDFLPAHIQQKLLSWYCHRRQPGALWCHVSEEHLPELLYRSCRQHTWAQAPWAQQASAPSGIRRFYKFWDALQVRADIVSLDSAFSDGKPGLIWTNWWIQ